MKSKKKKKDIKTSTVSSGQKTLVIFKENDQHLVYFHILIKKKKVLIKISLKLVSRISIFLTEVTIKILTE